MDGFFYPIICACEGRWGGGGGAREEERRIVGTAQQRWGKQHETVGGDSTALALGIARKELNRDILL